MKRYFLVDIENVGRTFLQGIERLTADDVIIICNNRMVKSEFGPSIIEGLASTKATVEKFYISSSVKNAMDFELVMELGYLIALNGNTAEYYVVSNDRGFDIVNDYLENKGLRTKVRRITTLEANYAEEERIRNMEAELQRLLPEFSKKAVKTVQQGIDVSNTAVQLHNFLQSHLKRDFTAIYPRVRHLVELEAQKA